MSGGTSQHSHIAGNLYIILATHLRGKICRAFNSDMKVLPRGEENPSYYPDVTVTCTPSDTQHDSTAIRFPHLIVEVLSRSTAARNTGRKLTDYLACPSVQEYLIISTRYQKAQLYQRQGTIWTYQQFTAGQDVTPISISLTFPLSALYQDTDVPPQRLHALPSVEPEEE